MKIHRLFFTCMSLAVLTAASVAQETINDVLADPALDINRPADRARAVERIRAIEEASLERARVKARAMGIPMRRELPGGRVTEIVGLDENGDFLIYTTHNVNAAISTAANLVNAASYNLNGSGQTVGVWDGGAVKTTHQEFSTGSRVTVRDGATTLSDHATHVAGTIAAAGVVANAKGMATQAKVDSYDWNSDTSEMLNRGATGSGQADKIYVSNHSYGFVEGWDGNTWKGTGTDQNAYDPQFGQYSSAARTWDDITYKAPYYLPFKSAGNDNSNNPAQGSSVVIGGNTVTYDRAIHPPGDGLYRNTTTNSTNGYENIGTNGTAKNIMTVGAANDAVTSGLRDPAKSTLTAFSSRGPTDDGRIKPDIVANGAGLYSPVSGSNNTSYGTYSGTSMSSPNAAGSAALLVQQYSNLFAGGAMRASTLKGLIIHTATDIGNPGPDYHYGWGLMNTKEAADLIIDHHANPTKNRMVEDQLTTSANSKIHTFAWDGTSSLRATLCWTDPPGDSTTTHDLRTPRLKNNLNLKLIAPNGNEYFPFVMPFVGTWTVASMSQPATTGINNTDPVEQVLISNPGQTGNWQAVVTYTGTLTNNLQNYSLLVSGVTDGIVPLVLQSITPNSGDVGTTVIADITGTALSADTQVRLRKAGRADIIGTSVQMLNATTLRCQFNLTGAASGAWSLVATNPDQETYTLPDAFTISGSLTSIWSENFDGTVTGWASTAQQGSNSWSVVTTASHSPTKSYFASGPASISITHLTSPQISMPTEASNLSLEFWHRYNLQADRDCGKFYLSIDNGAWFEVTDANSGAAFTLNGYNYSALATPPNQQQASKFSPFAGQPAWSGTTNGSFIRTTISFTDIPKYAGKNLRLRWTIATNDSTTSDGWWVDSISLLSDSSTPNQPPVITIAASTDTSEFETVGPTTYHVLRGTGTNLSVTATDDAGEGDLIYTWQATGPAAVTYSLNASNGAKTTTATFSAAGDYTITVTAVDTGGLTATSTVNVRVLETSTFVVTPESAILSVGGTQQFSATLINQFGSPNATQPSPINWSASGGGTISSGGLFTATTAGGPYLISAISGAYSDTAEATVNRIQAGIELQNLNRIYNGDPQVVTAITNPSNLAYSVTYNGQSTAPINGGSYDVVANITDPNYEGNTSGILVIAKAAQTITFAPLDPVGNDQQPFSLTATASSGLPASYTSSNPAVATVSGSTVTIIGTGTTTITALQPGNENYFAAANVSQELEVVPVIPTAKPGGPYKVLVGQSLSLNGSASTPSFGETLTAWEWDLNNDGTFGDATGATPAAIPFSTLINAWGMTQGFNTIQLRVTDSAAKTATATATVELVLALQWDANGTSSGQTNGGGAWLGNNLWWDGSANVNWAAGSNATIGGPSTAGGTVTLANPTTVNSFVFNTFTGTYTLGTSGQAITLNDGINKTSTSAAVTFVSPITLSGNQTWSNNSTGALSAPSGTDFVTNGGFQLTVDGTGTTNLGNPANTNVAITGSGALVKNGTGRLNIGGINSELTGTVTINGGVVHVPNNAGALGNGNVTLNGGVLSFYWGTTYTRSLGTGDNQARIPGGASGFAGSGTTGPTINLGSSVQWGSTFFNPSKFVLGDEGTGNAAVTTFSSAIDLNGATRTIVVPRGTSAAGNRSSISGAISNSTGTAGLIKEGAGTLNITSSSSAWNGTTTVTGGILDLGPMTNAAIGGGTGRTITVANGCAVRFNALSNTYLNRIVETTAEIGVMTGTTGNNLDFSSSTGVNLPNAFLGNWASNGAKAEISGTITPASDAYRLGAIGSSGLLGIVGTNKLTGNRGLIVGQTGATGIRVNLAAANNFSGDTVIYTGAKLTIGNNLALQNSALNVAAAGGNFALAAGTNSGRITGETEAASPTFGGLMGSRDLVSVFTNAGGNNETNLAATSVTGFTLNPGTGKSHAYSGAIADFATGTTLTKTGDGTQILAGANTYTGATSISAGRLFIDGSLSNVDTALTVAANATLGGTGTIGRNVTIESGGKLEFDISTPAASHDRLDISSGRSFIFSGASELTITTTGGAEPGIYTLVTGGNTISGIAPAAVNLPDGWLATVSISGNSLLLNVTSTGGDSPPTLAGIGNDQNGGPVTVNTLVTYTVTFSEDMDESTFNSEDFGNEGTASATIGTIQETTPGVFTVQVTPISAGTLQLRINQRATLKSAAGIDLDTSSAILDITIIDVQSPPPPGVLAVTAGDLVSSGTFGGTFTPQSAEYTLENTGGVLIDWSAGKSASWVSLSSSGGTLAPGASTTVTVSINPEAEELDAGGYNDTVEFTNTTNDNGSTTRGVSLTVNPIAVVVTLGNLNPSYDGTAKPVSVTTVPTPVAYTVTYNGESDVPVNAGSYAVVVTITEPNHSGSASGTLVIAPIEVDIALGNLSQTYDGNAKPVSVTTDPTPVAYTVTYDGEAEVPVNAGSYAVVVTITEPNHSGSASGALVIAPIEVDIALGNLSQTYDGSAKPVSVTTDPTPVAYTVTYDGEAEVPINAGSYAVVVTITEPNHSGSASGALVIAPIEVDIALGNLSQTYDGSAKPVSVTTDPTPVAYTVTYDGEAEVPVNAGSYAVVVTVTEPNHSGSASDTLVIDRASQTIDFAALEPVGAAAEPFELTATATSGLAVSYTSSNPTVATVSGSTVTIVAAGNTTLTASQAGDDNYLAAADVQQALQVVMAAPVDSFAISPINTPQTVGTPITGITITALDANDQIATSFTGTVTFGGTAGITGTSGNFVDGVLTGVSVTPTVAGSDLTFTVDDGAGHTGTVTIAAILSVFDDWASANGLTGDDALPNADPDGDGLTNLQEFAFGTDPTSGVSGPIAYDAGGNVTAPGTPVITESGGDYRAVFGRRKDYQAAGLSYIVEFSAGLDAWVAGEEVPVVVTGAESGSEIEAVSVSFPALIPVADGDAKPRFFRVGVSGD